jgi:GNAT superfamily N-acetyltransferase
MACARGVNGAFEDEMQHGRPLPVSLRPARAGDLDFCASLYLSEMEATMRAVKLDVTAHMARFPRQWEVSEVRILVLDGTDVGWLQTKVTEDALFLAQFFVAAALQRRGIGTQVLNRLLDEANQEGHAMTLAVVKINPALRLYERLGFRVTHEDDRKFYMRREPDSLSASRARLPP